jgi:hypothetical protein
MKDKRKKRNPSQWSKSKMEAQPSNFSLFSFICALARAVAVVGVVRNYPFSEFHGVPFHSLLEPGCCLRFPETLTLHKKKNRKRKKNL